MIFKKDFLNLILINGKISNNDFERVLRRDAFNLWLPSWLAVYKSVGSTYVPCPDDLLRQDAIHVLVYNEKVIGLLCYSFYDLRCSVNLRHSYMNFYDTHFIEYLTSQNKFNAMTIEYLTLSDEFRKSRIGFRITPILFRCSQEIMRVSGSDCILATARNDVKASQRLYEIGYHGVQKGVKKRGFDCDVMTFFSKDAIELKGDEYRVFDRLWRDQYISPTVSEIIFKHNKQGRRAA